MDATTDTCSLVVPSVSTDTLESDLEWLMALINARLESYFDPQRQKLVEFESIKPPIITDPNDAYGRFVESEQLIAEERLLLVLVLATHIRPQILDVFFTKNSDIGRGFSEFGGVQGANHSGFIPTVETALFIFAGDQLSDRLRFTYYLKYHCLLLTNNIIRLIAPSISEPWSSSILHLSPEFVDLLTINADYHPSYSSDFPARRISTGLQWQQLILPANTMEQLDEIRNWILHGKRLLLDWGMQDKLAPGFTSLFYGPPGTGKTLSACLLGKFCGCDVYKVDLSLMVSKYIGETEKNLAKVFDTAENRGWILFFDEADALFGKRTKVDDSHDRYANQEVSFLLQRIEEFSGVVILASNLKSNIDEAFIRRFQSVIHFPMPKMAERHQIWSNAFSERSCLQDNVNLHQLADKHDVSGGTIMNVVRFASLRAVSRDETTILKDDIEEGLRREYLKEGRRL